MATTEIRAVPLGISWPLQASAFAAYVSSLNVIAKQVHGGTGDKHAYSRLQENKLAVCYYNMHYVYHDTSLDNPLQYINWCYPSFAHKSQNLTMNMYLDDISVPYMFIYLSEFSDHLISYLFFISLDFDRKRSRTLQSDEMI